MTALPVGNPEAEYGINHNLFKWPDLKLQVEADRITDEGKCELYFFHANGKQSRTLLHMGQANLLSSTMHRDFIKSLNTRLDPKPDWQTILTSVSRLTMLRLRTGTPANIITGPPATSKLHYLVYPILELDQTSTIYAPGASGKSYIADLLAIMVQFGLPLKLEHFTWRAKKGNVLYLDWESTQPMHERRIWALKQGLGIDDSDIDTILMYRECSNLPLVSDLPNIQKLVHDGGIDLVIIDSQMAASGYGPDAAQTASHFYNGVKSLGCTTLVIDHVNRQDWKGDGESVGPYGCYSDDTEVLTEQGWLLHKDWQGQRIAAFNKQTKQITWEIPIDVHRYHFSGHMYHFISSKYDMLVTPTHRMVSRKAWSQYRKGSEWEFTNADSFKSSEYKFPLSGHIVDTDHKAKSYSMPSGRKFPLEAFMAFLGLYISEGSLTRDRIQISQNCGYTLAQIQMLFSRLGFTYHSTPLLHSHNPHYNVVTHKDTELATWIREECLGGSHSKRLPRFIFTLNKRYRTILLKALLDGDGTYRKYWAAAYATVSAGLANDIQELALSIGFFARVSTHQSSYNGKQFPFYRVTIDNQHEAQFEARNNLEMLPYSGNVYCFTVTTGAYVTRRNGKPAFQGNSVVKYNRARSLFQINKKQYPGEPYIDIAFQHKKHNEGLLLQPMGMRIKFNTNDEVLGSVTFESIDPEDVLKTSDVEGTAPKGTLADTIEDALNERPMTLQDVADKIGKPVLVTKAILNRYNDSQDKYTPRFKKQGELWTLAVDRNIDRNTFLKHDVSENAEQGGF